MNHARARANAYVRQLERKRTVRRDRTVGEPLSARQISRAVHIAKPSHVDARGVLIMVPAEPVACKGCGYMVCDCESRVAPFKHPPEPDRGACLKCNGEVVGDHCPGCMR